MIKALAGDIILFGLSARNIERLKQGDPILVHLKEFGLTGRVLIFYGETEETIRAEFRERGLLPADAAPEGGKPS